MQTTYRVVQKYLYRCCSCNTAATTCATNAAQLQQLAKMQLVVAITVVLL